MQAIKKPLGSENFVIGVHGHAITQFWQRIKQLKLHESRHFNFKNNCC